MSVNIVQSDLSLKNIAGNVSPILCADRFTTAQIDTLLTGSQTGSGTYNLTKSYSNYDYIEILIGNKTYPYYDVIRYKVSSILESSSSNKCRYFSSSDYNFAFYKNGSSTTSLYFSKNTWIIKKIYGVKYGVTKVKSESPQQADIYTTNTVKTGGKWIDGKDIYRTIFEYTLTTAVSSSATKIQTAKSITFTTLIKSKCFAISSSKYMYTVPYINSTGNSISLDVISSGNNISLINKGMSWNSGTVFRFILEYTI